jgi:hypothetical protein
MLCPANVPCVICAICLAQNGRAVAFLDAYR